jgi:hypothetical protein
MASSVGANGEMRTERNVQGSGKCLINVMLRNLSPRNQEMKQNSQYDFGRDSKDGSVGNRCENLRPQQPDLFDIIRYCSKFLLINCLNEWINKNWQN